MINEGKLVTLFLSNILDLSYRKKIALSQAGFLSNTHIPRP